MDDILKNIKSPKDLKNLSPEELEKLTGEIRGFLIENISKTGGHMASNLGTVELTIALHLAFDSPKDKIIFDVGHQSYTHKILTGRQEGFKSLRQFNGMSGFPKPEESEHDVFKGGHSSTSISVATGFAHARRLSGEDYSVVAVIGDGALTGGMAFEALNDFGRGKDKIIVVLNDNQMSIGPNVGAMNARFAKLRLSPKYYNLKRRVEKNFNKIPVIGKPTAQLFSDVKKAVKSVFIKNLFFEEMGYTYIGVVDGHDIFKLKLAFERAKMAPKSVIVHVMTKKGKGYKLAEDNPGAFHGVSPKKANDNGSNSGIFGKKLLELALKDDKIVAITAAMASGTGLDTFAKELPERFFDVGIAEQHATTMAAGMAKMGFKPVFAVYSTFLQRAYDQVFHDICLQKLPVVICIDRAGLVGADGETHHGLYDIAFLRTLPGITLLEPATEGELLAMLEYALTLNAPVCIRYPRERLPRGEQEAIIGDIKSDIICPLGDVNIIACGKYVKTAKEIAEEMGGVGVINARTLKPIDEDTIKEVLGAKKGVIVIENGVCAGGYGSSVLEFAMREGISTKIKLLGIPDMFIQHGSTAELEKVAGVDPDSIRAAVREIKYGKD